MLDLEAFAAEQNIFEKREGEKKGTAFLLKKLFPGHVPELAYTEAKKPYFKDSGLFISITHSHAKLAIMVNSKEHTGVDVELIRDKVLNIRHKFLSEREQKFAGNDVEKLTVLWAAKEAIYKAYGLKEIDFAKHMSVEEFDNTNDLFYGTLQKNEIKQRYLLKKEKHDNYILVYTLNEVR
jgi:phosphopantetheinyl transferase